MSRFERVKGDFQSRQLSTVESETLSLDILHGWPEIGPKYSLRGPYSYSIVTPLYYPSKAGQDIEADYAKANKAVVTALDTIAKWVAKLSPVARIVSPVPTSLVL